MLPLFCAVVKNPRLWKNVPDKLKEFSKNDIYFYSWIALYQHTAEMKPEELDCLQPTWAFIDSKKALFSGKEMIVYLICVASITISVESIIESFVSIYENRNKKKR